jgi:hypothetical protein
MLSKSGSRAMAVSPPVEHQQRSSELFETKHSMECTTLRKRVEGSASMEHRV